jgi:HAD superfamily phosphoserine phosphatase-like hydrolase
MEIHCWKRRAGAGNQERDAGGDVKDGKEMNEIKEGKEVQEKSERVAAFFDLDGTLVALPSLERRFFRTLRYRREIRAKNWFSWLREALRLMPRGINAILQGNKMYLRGLRVFDECGQGDGKVFSWHKGGHQAGGQASAPLRRNPRLPVPSFFAQAIEMAAWHAEQGHEVVMISGTLEPLARAAGRALETGLAARGITIMIRVIATRLEEMDGKWTGRILGVAMFGKAKARAAKRLAEEMRLDLGQCYVYGDSLHDRWLMGLVGRPMAVNPSRELAEIARTRGWPMLNWEGEKSLTQRAHRSRRAAQCDGITPRFKRAER